MKKFSKIIIAVLAIAVLSVSFAGCGLVEDTEVVEKVKIQSETMLTIGDDITVSGAYYGWYFENAYMTAYTEASQAASENSADSAADSAAAPEDVKVDLEKVKKEAIDEIVAIKMACAKAKEAGIELTDADYANINMQAESIRSQLVYAYSQMGGASYADILREMNTNIETISEVVEDQYLASLYYAPMVAQDYVTVKHILVMYGEESRTKDEAKKLADDIKSQLDGGADFDALMNQYSEDSKDASGKFASYTFTKDGAYVQPFKDMAFSLEEGQISAPVNVEDSYNGYHILKRVPVEMSEVANAIEGNTKIDAEREKLVAGAKVTENKKISFYSDSKN